MIVPRNPQTSRTALKYLPPVVVSAVVIAFAAATASGGENSDPPNNVQATPLTAIGKMGGPPIALMPADARALQRFVISGYSLENASVLATRNARTYFRIANKSGSDCYAVGPVHATEYRLGQIMCAADFPSRERAVLDFTVLTQPSPDHASARVVRSEGFAADGVVDVGFETDDGQLVVITPVVNNVYSVVAPPGQHVAKLLARDAIGDTVWSQPFSPVSLGR